jgi:hypothetical protein
MADDPSELTQPQKDLIAKRIVERWGGTHECPVCHDNKWTLLPHLTTPVKLVGLTGKLNFPGSTVYPEAHLVCGTCGYTMTFNVSALGIEMERPQSKADQRYGQNLEVKSIVGDLIKRLEGDDDAKR